MHVQKVKQKVKVKIDIFDLIIGMDFDRQDSELVNTEIRVSVRVNGMCMCMRLQACDGLLTCLG